MIEYVFERLILFLFLTAFFSNMFLCGVEKWDGLLPKVNGNGGMILNLNHDDL